MAKKEIVAQLHTPEELLAGAESLLAKDDSHFNRAAVLEAITALEAYVESMVFQLLESSIDPLLVRWLKEKTRMDFDTRLGVLTPVATARPVTKDSELWQRYKRAKEIRNKVTHSGRRVSWDEAKEVVQTVYDWMAHLGSTAELDLALLGLKKYIERGALGTNIRSPQEYEEIVAKYFIATKAAEARLNAPLGDGRGAISEADLILSFGKHRVVVEVRFLRKANIMRTQIDRAFEFVKKALVMHGFSGAAIVFFCADEGYQAYPLIERRAEGKISAVAISIGEMG